VSCYFRHLIDVFDEAGVELTSANRKQVDQTVHQVLAVEYKECSVTWKRLRQEILGDEEKRREFVQKLRKAWNSLDSN
jgi:hypothetical protein